MFAARYRPLLILAMALCGAVCVITALRWHWQLAAARQAAEELATCQALAAEIKSLRMTPRSASLNRQSDQQVSLTIERAAQLAEIPESDIVRIAPQQGRRLGKSPHVQQPTAVEIRQTTLGQLSRLLRELADTDVGLQPTSVRLTAPRIPLPETRTESWVCELVLTYLVFSPE